MKFINIKKGILEKKQQAQTRMPVFWERLCVKKHSYRPKLPKGDGKISAIFFLGVMAKYRS
jgi:hypothetical protein